MDRDQQMRRRFHVAATSSAADPYTAAGIDAPLAIQRQSIHLLCDYGVRDKAWARAGLRDDLCAGTAARIGACALHTAGIDWADDLKAVKLAGLILDLLGDLLADFDQSRFLLFG